MYRSGEKYDHVDKLAIDILIDYGISSFPLDMSELCRKMNINLVPYSAYESGVELLMKKSIYGFSAHRTENDNPTIYYNDVYGEHLSQANISSTIGHEIRHILDGDEDDSEDDLCNHFSRMLRCPAVLVIYHGITSQNELISRFGISATQATYVLGAVHNRIKKYGYAFFRYEIEYLQFLYGDEILDELQII
mgnify:CR=1 FL=1